MSGPPEYQTIRKNLSTLADAISSQPSGPTWFEDQLYQEGFIDNRGTISASLEPYERVSQLLGIVEHRVKAPYLNTAVEFRKFMEILQRKVTYKDIAEHLQNEFRKFAKLVEVQGSSASAGGAAHGVSVEVKQTASGRPGDTVTKPGGTVTKPGDTVTKPGGTVTKPGGTVTKPGGTESIPPDTESEPAHTVSKLGDTDADVHVISNPGDPVSKPGDTATQELPNTYGVVKVKPEGTVTKEQPNICGVVGIAADLPLSETVTESTKDRAAELQPTLSDKERTGDANELPAGQCGITAAGQSNSASASDAGCGTRKSSGNTVESSKPGSESRKESGVSMREHLTILGNFYSIVMTLAADVNPILFARKLHAVNLVSQHFLAKAGARDISAIDRLADMIEAVQSEIHRNPATYHTFLNILKDVCPVLAERLTKYHSTGLEVNATIAVRGVVDWQELGCQLNYNPEKLSLLLTFGQTPEDSREKMISDWAMQADATWDKLVRALDQMGERQLARTIHQEFISPRAGETRECQAEVPQFSSSGHDTTQVKQVLSKEATSGVSRDVQLSELASDETHPIGRYKLYLQSVYQPRMKASYDKLPGMTLSDTIYINLAVIDKVNSINSDVSEMHPVTNNTLHWDIDNIIENKRAVKLEEVGKLEDGTLAKRIVVQGAPGVGKTTMALEICRRWREESLLAEYSLVILLRMRDTRVQEAKSISDLFFHYDPKLREAVVKHVADAVGEGVLFIIEGFDELSDERQKSSIFADLIKGAILERAAVMVMTRPSAGETAASNLPTESLQHVEVVGFTREQIDEYVGELISNKDLVRNFQQCLARFPYIRGIMYVPFNCAIVVMVYRYNRGRGSLPKLQTGLYTELTRILLLTHMCDQPEYRNKRVYLPTIDNLPHYFLTQFLTLCELAYNSILGNKLIFKCLPPGANTLGLFEGVPDMHNPQATSYNFLHLSLQEYLAALHISKLPLPEQTRCFDSLVGNLRIAVVLRFLAGLTRFHFQSYANMGFWDKLFKSKAPADSLRMFIHSQDTFIETIHWLYESEDSELALRALGSQVQSQNLSNKLLSPFDCYALGYCLSCSECIWRLELQNCNIDPEGIKNLTTTDGILLRVQVLDLSRNNIGEAGENLAQCLMGNSVLSVLKLRDCSIDANNTLQIARGLRRMTTLTTIDLGFNEFSATGMEMLAVCVKNSENLIDLRLSCCSIGDLGMTYLSRALSQSTTLKEVQLQRNPFGFAGAQELAKAIESNRCIESLSLLGCNTLGDEGIARILQSLTGNPIVQRMFLPDTLRHVVTQNHSHLSSRVLWLPDVATQKVVNLSEKAVDVTRLASALKLNTSITELVLKECRITADDTAHLAEAIRVISTLKVLDLSGNRMGTKGARSLAQALRTNPVLSVLKLRDCDIDADGTSLLPELAMQLSTITVFELSFNNFNSDGLKKIGEGVRGSSNMKELRLNSCGIDDDGIAILSGSLLPASNLKRLEVQRNVFGPTGAQALARMIEGRNSIESIALLGCDAIGEEGTITLLQSLAVNQSVQTLFLPDIYEHTVGSEHSQQANRVVWLPDIALQSTVDLSGAHVNAEGLASGLMLNSDITELSLNGCNIGPGSMTHLSHGLKTLSNLKSLDLSGNRFGSVGANNLASALNSLGSLMDLRLPWCGSGADGTVLILQALSTVSALKGLDFSGSIFNSEGVNLLRKYLRANATISVLKLRDCNIDAEGTSQLAEVLKLQNDLTTVDLSFNAFDINGIKVLAESLTSGPNLTVLRLSSCSIGNEGMFYLSAALKHCLKLKELELNGNPFEPVGSQNLAKLIKGSTSIRNVFVLGCDAMQAEGTTSLLQAVSRNQNVFLPEVFEQAASPLYGHLATRVVWLPDIFTEKLVDLSGRRFSKKHTTQVATALRSNRNLTELKLGGCALIPERTVDLLQPLSSMSTLKVLDFSGNRTNMEGAKHLATALATNTDFAELRLGGCGISKEGTRHVLQALTRITTLKILELSWNKLDLQGAKYLATALATNTDLTELGLGGCGISEEGTRCLMQALTGITTLEFLDLSLNKLDLRGAEYLALTLKRNINLTDLQLGDCGLGDDAVCALVEGLHSHPSLQTLSLRGNTFGGRGGMVIAAALAGGEMGNLQSLILYGCKSLRGAAAVKLVDSLENNTTMRMLGLPREYRGHVTRSSSLYSNFKVRVKWS